MNQDKELSRPKWLKEGFVATSNWEPLIFRRRAGSQSRDEVKKYGQEHSEETVKRLKSQGVSIAMTHFFKGFGIEAEKEEMENTKNFTELCHKHGIKVAAYVQFGSLMYETFFIEVPEARNWLQVNQSGRAIGLDADLVNQPFRKAPCWMNEGFLSYLEKVLEKAINYAKVDMIHFDNYGYGVEPESCRCENCRNSFREYLEKKYDTPEKRRERFGFDNLQEIQPPVYERWGSPGKVLSLIKNPATQEWVNFRTESLVNTTARLSGFIRKLNPEAVVEINAMIYSCGENQYFFRGLDLASISKYTNAMFDEEGSRAGINKEGILTSRIRAFKMGQIWKNIMIIYQNKCSSPQQLELSLAETLVFNKGMIGVTGNIMKDLEPEHKKYIELLNNNKNRYMDSESMAEVAVLRSKNSLAYNNSNPHLGVVLFEQTLIQSGIPFDIIFDDNLKGLKKYKVLVLPDSECMDDGQIKLVKDFVNAGGGAVFTENASLFDEWHRTREKHGLGGMFKEETLTAAKKTEYGKGRIAYIPQIIPVVPFIYGGKEWQGDVKYWHLPKNYKELIESVKWASGDSLSLEVKAPVTVVTDMSQNKQLGEIYLHLLNYNYKKPVKNIKIRVKKNKAKDVICIFPDNKTKKLKFYVKNDEIMFIVPKLDIYNMIVIKKEL